MGRKLGTTIGDSTVVINGDITCYHDTTIGAEVNGNIKADNDATITIAGRVVGNIETLGRVEVLSGAAIVGDIKCKTIIADAGCIINGKLMTANNDEKEVPDSFF